MPIKEGKARLWFGTKAEADAYDDRMVANIELKSQDFDDENFSPVFNRKTQEYFLEPSEKFKSDHAKILRPLQSVDFQQAVDKYILIPPNHTFYRNWTFEKFIGGFGLSYLLLRELPLRNFYARVFVMYVFTAKLLDHLGNPFPFSGKGSIIGAADRWHHWEVRCYDNVMKALRYIRIPTVQNQVPEATKWYGRQPGHMLRADCYWAPNLISQRFAHHKQAPWDGTQNMPIFRLADPKHKDSFMVQFR